MTDLESTIITMLLAGPHPALAVLREQFAQARVASREFSENGFFLDLEIPESAPRLPHGNFVLGDVGARLTGVEHDASFLLYVVDGMIGTLECVVEKEWPEDPELIEAFYIRHEPAGADTFLLERAAQRDLVWLARELG